MHKKTIVYCDDQQRFIDEFISRHEQYYDIISLTDSRNLENTIEKFNPDLVLIDLYYPRDYNQCFEKNREEAESELAKLDQQIATTKQAVLRAWEPRGLDLLKMLREKYGQARLPIAIYTQKGLILLDDEQLRSVEENDGHWLLKRSLSARTEEIRIDRIISENDNQKFKFISLATQRYRIILVISWWAIGFLIANNFFNYNRLIEILIGIIAAIFSYPIIKWIDRSH